MASEGLHDVLGLGVGVPDLDGPVSRATDDEDLREYLLVKEAPDFSLMRAREMAEPSHFVLSVLGESLTFCSSTFLLNFLGANCTIAPSLSPQVNVSVSALNLQHTILTFSARFCCFPAIRVDFVSRSLTSRNSFVLINYIPDTQIILVQLSTRPIPFIHLDPLCPQSKQALLQLLAG